MAALLRNPRAGKVPVPLFFAAVLVAIAIVLTVFLAKEDDGAGTYPASPAASAGATTTGHGAEDVAHVLVSPERQQAPVASEPAPPAESTAATAPDPEMAAWGPWRKMRLEELDRSLEEVRKDLDPQNRQMTLQMFIIAAVSPLADELGLSQPSATADRTRLTDPNEHAFLSNQNFYRVPVGTFPELDDFMRTWNEREARRAATKSASARLQFESTDLFPMDQFTPERMGDLAERARAAIRRRTEAY